MEVKWTDSIGVVHTVNHAEIVVQELFDAWPCGLDEIDASLDNWRTVAARADNELSEVCTKLEGFRTQCAEQLCGITDMNSNEFITMLMADITVVLQNHR